MNAESGGPRPRAQRRHDTEARLHHDIDLWVASADQDVPYLVPLSFTWDGATILLATLTDSPTGRNLTRAGAARLALGHTRDVTMIEGTAETIAMDALPRAAGDDFAERTGFDPRTLTGYSWFRVAPVRIQAWRESDEIADRDLMRAGFWL